MRMLWTIARKEIISNLLSYKFFVVILLTVILIFTSLFIMHRDFKERLSDYHLIKPEPEEPIAVVPPNPLSMFVKGLEDAMTRSYEVGVIGVDVRAGQSSGNVIFSFFPTPDFLYIAKVVLSLVALLFGFDQISREKEQGTLSLTLSNSVSRAKVIFGKWIGNYISLVVPFLLVVLLGVVLLNLDSDIHFSSDQFVRLTVILFFTLIFMAFFLSLGIFISTLTKKGATSIVILLFLWALLVFIIPNLGTLLARQIVEVPSVRALSEKRNQVWTREILLGINAGDFEERYYRIHAEHDQLEDDYRHKFNRLVRLSKNINRLSPVSSYVYALTEISGTGIGEEAFLKKSVIGYKNSILGDVISARFKGENRTFPSYSYRYRSLSQIFAEGALFDMAWLIFFNILLFALSYFVFVRYDAR
jgi:ABC-type transport system involved in multi-copper enzyme maturation permease subunit